MREGTTGGSRVFDVAWRVLVVAVVYSLLFLAWGLVSGGRPSVQRVGIGLVTGDSGIIGVGPEMKDPPDVIRAGATEQTENPNHVLAGDVHFCVSDCRNGKVDPIG